MIARTVAPRALLLVALALAYLVAPPPVAFIQPRSRVVLASPYGTEIPVQVRVEPTTANRALVIEWCTGRSARSLDGADDTAVQPIKPLSVRVFAGTCVFTATVYDSNRKQLARAQLDVHVCDGECDR